MKKRMIFCTVILLLLSMSVSVCAEFSPSVSAKPAPELAGSTIMIDGEIKSDKTVDIYSYADTQAEGFSGSPAAKTLLENSFNEINGVKSLADLNKGKKDTAGLKKELQKRAKEYGDGYAASQFDVRDFFDVTVGTDISKKLDGGENYVEVKLTGYNPEKEPVILYRCTADDEWAAVSADDVSFDEEGNLVIKFRKLCPVAVAEIPEGVKPAYNFPIKPWEIAAIVLAVLLILIIILIVAVSRRNGGVDEEEYDVEYPEDTEMICAVTARECVRADHDCTKCPLAKDFNMDGKKADKECRKNLNEFAKGAFVAIGSVYVIKKLLKFFDK